METEQETSPVVGGCGNNNAGGNGGGSGGDTGSSGGSEGGSSNGSGSAGANSETESYDDRERMSRRPLLKCCNKNGNVKYDQTFCPGLTERIDANDQSTREGHYLWNLILQTKRRLN